MNGKILAPARAISLTNLLGNSYFPSWFLINQYGYVSGSASTPWSYFIDRWKNASSTGWAYTLSSAGIGLPAGANMLQRLEHIEGGATLTFAVKKSGGEIIAVSGEVIFDTGNTWLVCAEETRDGVLLRMETQKNVLGCRIEALNTSVTLEWAGLYEGIYTADTVPRYIRRLHSAELLECQRYYYSIMLPNANFCAGAFDKTTARFAVLLPTIMQKHPDVDMTEGELNIIGTDRVQHKAVSATTNHYKNDCIGISLKTSGLTQNEIYTLHGNGPSGQSIITLDANI